MAAAANKKKSEDAAALEEKDTLELAVQQSKKENLEEQIIDANNNNDRALVEKLETEEDGIVAKVSSLESEISDSKAQKSEFERAAKDAAAVAKDQEEETASLNMNAVEAGEGAKKVAKQMEIVEAVADEARKEAPVPKSNLRGSKPKAKGKPEPAPKRK